MASTGTIFADDKVREVERHRVPDPGSVEYWAQVGRVADAFGADVPVAVGEPALINTYTAYDGQFDWDHPGVIDLL